MVRISYLIFFICGLLIISLTYCNRDKELPEVAHQFLTVGEFNKLSRVEQVKMCGSCHPKEYENEMKGPHANAYKMLEAHIAYANSPNFDQQEYCKYITTIKGNCVGCHATQTLFQEVFNKMPDNQESADKLIATPRGGPEIRKDLTSHITGIDCITCHYDGNSVVTKLGSSSQPNAASVGKCAPYCMPKKSAIFSSNASCVPCHMEQVQMLDNNFEAGIIKSKDCNTCHAEYDTKGKYTHYYYWAHDPANKKRPEHLDMFAGIACNINSSRNGVDITWTNTAMPHPVSVCTELRAKLTAYDEKGNIIASKTIHANRKPEQDQTLQKFYTGRPVPGGHDFTMGGKEKSKSFTMPLPTTQHGKIKVVVEGVKMEQYWLSDTIGTKIHYRELSL